MIKILKTSPLRCVLPLGLIWAILIVSSAAPSNVGDAPSVEQFKAALTAELLKLKPGWAKERTVLFQSVKAGTSKSGTYPFLVSAAVHDYGTGYPANKHYGQTTLGIFEDANFLLTPDDFGGWRIEGALTPRKSLSKDNPSEGVSAIPLDTLQGTPSGKAPQNAQIPDRAAKTVKLPTGEWASYGAGGRLLIGLGFVLKADGTYTNLDGNEGGKYVHNATAATITFKGGFMDGKVGKNVKPSGFQLSDKIVCEPYR